MIDYTSKCCGRLWNAEMVQPVHFWRLRCVADADAVGCSWCAGDSVSGNPRSKKPVWACVFPLLNGALGAANPSGAHHVPPIMFG